MTKDLTESDIEDGALARVYTQDYSKKLTIEGVELINLNNHVGEEGDFSELLRFKENGCLEVLPDFKILQINRTKLYKGAIKGWHLHLKQDDLWYVIPYGHLIVGLWDLRKDSKTKGAISRIVLGGGKSELLFIPRGVAHGAVNVAKKEVEILYFMNQKFDPKDPDEKRLKWDSLGADFWKPLKD